MPYQIASGLTATKSATPDMTFVWGTQENGNTLQVSVKYGGGTDISNSVSVDIPWGSNQPQPIGPGTNADILVKGSVQAYWGDYDCNKTPKSYVVTFAGNMIRGGFNNIGSDQTLTDGAPQVIVYTHLG
jgi:hypothetical protein